MELFAILAAVFAVALILWRLEPRVVRDFERGLLIKRGRLVRELDPGAYRLWAPRTEIEVFDLREQTLALPVQEITTKDRVPVKATLTLTYRVADPKKVRAISQDAWSEIYRAGQAALRDAVLSFELDELLEDRAPIAVLAAPAIEPELERLGFALVRVRLLDVIVRGEIKRAYGDVVVARAEARAKLERARGESAALRNLANAARLLKENDGLYQLRLLETAQTAATASSNSLVLGLREGLELPNGR